MRDGHRGRDGREKARLFRQYRLAPEQRETRRCDVDAILAEDRLVVCESLLDDCGYAACLLRMPDGGGGIMIAKGQDPGRRRFSLAHELGHYHIPSHAGAGVASCADADLRARSTDAHRREWEANDFATELLMPYRLFAHDVAGREVTFATVVQLAAPEMYDVSFTAAAWRLIETTGEPCAMVVAVDGVVQWVVRSEAWHFALTERRQALPAGSMAHFVAGGDAPNERAEFVDPGLWLSSGDGRRRPDSRVRLLESTHAIPRLRQVVSLLWVVEE
jgi:Zn-dependent peptidase ImmA (M78 family)